MSLENERGLLGPIGGWFSSLWNLRIFGALQIAAMLVFWNMDRAAAAWLAFYLVLCADWRPRQ